MTDKIEEIAKKQVTEFLPGAIEKTLESYHNFVGTPEDADTSKNYKDHQTACKVGLSHIALLLKLANWTDTPADASGEAAPGFTESLGLAKKEMNEYKEQEDSEADEDLA